MEIQTLLQKKKDEVKRLEADLMDPAVIGDRKKLEETNKAYHASKALLTLLEDYHQKTKNLKHAQELLNEDDTDIRELAQQEIAELEAAMP